MQQQIWVESVASQAAGFLSEEIKAMPLISTSTSAGVNKEKKKTTRHGFDRGAATRFLRNFKKELVYWLGGSKYCTILKSFCAKRNSIATSSPLIFL